MHRALVLISPNDKLIGRYRTGDVDNLDSFHVDPIRHLCRMTAGQPLVAVRSNDGLGVLDFLEFRFHHEIFDIRIKQTPQVEVAFNQARNVAKFLVLQFKGMIDLGNDPERQRTFQPRR